MTPEQRAKAIVTQYATHTDTGEAELEDLIASAIRSAESSARQKAEQERDEARAERDAALAENDVNHKWIYCPMCGSCGIGGCCGYFCDLCRDHHDGETPGGSPPRDLGDLRLMQGGWKELVAAAEASAAALRNAVSAVYYAAHWTPDRPVDAAKLWTDLRDAAGFEPGRAPSPEAAGKETP